VSADSHLWELASHLERLRTLARQPDEVLARFVPACPHASGLAAPVPGDEPATCTLNKLFGKDIPWAVAKAGRPAELLRLQTPK